MEVKHWPTRGVIIAIGHWVRWAWDRVYRNKFNVFKCLLWLVPYTAVIKVSSLVQRNVKDTIACFYILKKNYSIFSGTIPAKIDKLNRMSQNLCFSFYDEISIVLLPRYRWWDWSYQFCFEISISTINFSITSHKEWACSYKLTRKLFYEFQITRESLMPHQRWQRNNLCF